MEQDPVCLWDERLSNSNSPNSGEFSRLRIERLRHTRETNAQPILPISGAAADASCSAADRSMNNTRAHHKPEHYTAPSDDDGVKEL